MSLLTISELEAAINYWRQQSPASGDELRLCREAAALARPYAFMIMQGSRTMPLEALEASARQAWEHYQSSCQLNHNN